MLPRGSKQAVEFSKDQLQGPYLVVISWECLPLPIKTFWSRLLRLFWPRIHRGALLEGTTVKALKCSKRMRHFSTVVQQRFVSLRTGCEVVTDGAPGAQEVTSRQVRSPGVSKDPLL